MPSEGLRIAWLGGPGQDGSAGLPGVVSDLLDGLAKLGHHVDCFVPAGRQARTPGRLARVPNITLIWKPTHWRWNRWYSRTMIAAFASGLAARSVAEFRLRREVVRRHRKKPYDVVVQVSRIESFSSPSRLTKDVPLVIVPATHAAGELRSLMAERQLSLRCQPRHVFAVLAAILLVRSVLQRFRVHRARLILSPSSVLGEQIVRDYRFPPARTVVVPYPVRLSRFRGLQREPETYPTVLVLGRISVRKGLDDVLSVAWALAKTDVRLRIVGGPSLWSDYTGLLTDLPRNAEYAGQIMPSDIPATLARCDVLLQASKYEPFGLTVAEALAAGTPVVATSQVGAIEGVDSSVLAVVEPGDVTGMVSAIRTMSDRARTSPSSTASAARAEAARLFAPDVVCQRFANELEQVAGRPSRSDAS
jgi:glycosyltransferase involved in cell wall biosynthesis